MFHKFLCMDPDPDQARRFEDQHLVILMKKMEIGSKGAKKVSHKCLWDANEIIAIQRNPIGQIYFALQLDSFTHLSLGPSYFRHLSNVRSNIMKTIKNDDNYDSDVLNVWNKDSENCRFVEKTSDLIRRMIPSISKVMKNPTTKDTRGTIAMNIGITTNNCGQYRNNRSTIFGNIKPSLTKVRLYVCMSVCMHYCNVFDF